MFTFHAVLVVAALLLFSVPLALAVGRGIRIADDRETATAGQRTIDTSSSR